MSVHHEFDALKKMKLSAPQKMGTPKPTVRIPLKVNADSTPS
jgi:hypothetical protein